MSQIHKNNISNVTLSSVCFITLFTSSLVWSFSYHHKNALERAAGSNESLYVLQLTVFGDSLDDNGNFYAFTDSLHNPQKAPNWPYLSPHLTHLIARLITEYIRWPIPSLPYSSQRFSNNLLPVDYYARFFNLNTHNKTQYRNLAHSGSTVRFRLDKKYFVNINIEPQFRYFQSLPI